MNETQSQRIIDLLERLVVAAEMIASNRTGSEVLSSPKEGQESDTNSTKPSQLGDERDLASGPA